VDGGAVEMKSAEEEGGSIKEPVIVVSDVHLGGKESNAWDFRDFLDWLTTLPVDGQAFACDGENLTIKRPGTLVLLGDILELWDPEKTTGITLQRMR
jgi:UDP-2,3-diacylglucosamine pyrophosphatase LpxH